MSEPEAGGARRRVRVLAPEVANQIAAGEVVERPASVVKELVENALDAAARHIAIDIEAAGSALIAVVDDGEGMTREDAVAAFARHATSKVVEASDLERITTLGFRGEALASIAAVSRTTLVTRRAEDVAGTYVGVPFGTIETVREEGCPPGTRVEVADLFGNTPARRKFLKAAATEAGHISEWVTRAALAWPGVGFTLRHGTRTLARLPAVEDHGERLRQVVGDERARAMLSCLHRGAAGCVYGWIGAPSLTFPTARQIYTYVNRRYVRDRLVSHALVAGYRTLLMHGRHPAAVLFIDVPLEDVDVNVHPAKSEVRFHRSGAIHELISHGVQKRLRQEGHRGPDAGPSFGVSRGFPAARGARGGRQPILRLEPAAARAAGAPAGTTASAGGPAGDWALAVSAAAMTTQVANGAPEQEVRAPESEAAASQGFFSSLRVIGQVFDGYLVCEQNDGLVLIDQHAAHERVTFEQLRAAYGRGSVPGQRLLVPAVVELGPREAALLRQRLGELDAIGFEVEDYGGRSFSVRAVPALLGDCDPVVLINDVAAELADVGRTKRLDEAAEAVLARLACHSAVRVGQRLNDEQIQGLLRAMDDVDFAGNCPHGRPAFVRLRRGELERWFRRT